MVKMTRPGRGGARAAPRRMCGWARALVPALATLLAWVAAPSLTSAAPPTVNRVAVVVGANAAAPGRRPLAHGHRDANKMASALVAVAGFRREDVHVLHDPAPEQVMAVLGRTIAGIDRGRETLLYFYYSGHADDRALYPAGKAMPIEGLRSVLDRAPAQVRIGMVDACRGGGWTRAKGVTVDEPFPVRWPLSLDSEGSVLIASSSGLESAHESDDLQGSFFTHHFIVGLRGAADQDGNRQVTLTEAFEFAKERTILDSIRHTRETQHPSYAVNLRGRRDLVLAHIDDGASTVELAQLRGPLELIHAESGIELLELQPGRRRVKVVVPPGRYLVRKLGAGSPAMLREIFVEPGITTTIEEEQLTLVATKQLTTKAYSPGNWLVVEGSGGRKPAPGRPAQAEGGGAGGQGEAGIAVGRRAEAAGAGEDRSHDDREAAAGQAVVAHVPPAATPARPRWLKVSTAAAVVTAVAAGALAVKFAYEVRYYNERLDPFRRFECPSMPSTLCDSAGNMKPSLTAAEQAFVQSESAEGRRWETYQGVAMGVSALAIVASIPLVYYLVADPDPESQHPRSDALTWLPSFGATGAGLQAVGRF